MQELASSIEHAARPLDAGTGLLALEEAGIKWADFSLRNFQGKLLKRAIAISVAISEFEYELQQKDQQVEDPCKS